MAEPQKLRIGYVPEHFATPLHFAYSKFGASDYATLHPFPAGTGVMVEAFKANEIDLGIGLVEGWVAGLIKYYQELPEAVSKMPDTRPFHLTGRYTDSPLRWAISTGANRSEINSVEELRGKKIGISRLGSGSHIMGTVLADKHGWLGESTSQFEFVQCGPFRPLREAVTSGTADFFMWEHYTTKKYFDDGTLKRLGEIETPWPAWYIATRGVTQDDRVVKQLIPALDAGRKYFLHHKAEAVDFISSTMEYSKQDAESWYAEVVFSQVMTDVPLAEVKAIQQVVERAGGYEKSTSVSFVATS